MRDPGISRSDSGESAEIGEADLPEVAETHGDEGRSGSRPERAAAVLGRGRSVVVVGRDLTLDEWIATVQLALSKARRARSYGLQLDAFLKMLRDMGTP